MNGPKPTETHPMKGFDQVCYLKNVIRNFHIIVGDYNYYDDPVDSEGFERNVLYHYPFMEDKLIMPGVTIGDGAIIAARSVVVKDVAPCTVVGGNPAKEIRKRFDEETIDLLERVKWWDWPAEKITLHLELLTSNDLQALRRLLEHNM